MQVLSEMQYGRTMGSAVPMTVKVYPLCSFQAPNVLLPYILSDPLRVAPIGVPHAIQKKNVLWNLITLLSKGSLLALRMATSVDLMYTITYAPNFLKVWSFR